MVILFTMHWLSTPFVKQTDEDFLIETYFGKSQLCFLIYFLLFLDCAFSLFIIFVAIERVQDD